MNSFGKNIIHNSLIAILCVVGYSCDNPVALQPLRSPDGKTPIVTGLRVTSEKSPDEIDVWGFPNDPQVLPPPPIPPRHSSQNEPEDVQRVINPIPFGFGGTNPYPNPMKNATVIRFQLPITMMVSVWIVPAKLATEYTNNLSLVSANHTKENGEVAIAELIRDEIKSAGTYEVFWNRNDRNGNKVKQGVYRVYTRSGEYLFWRDILIWDDDSHNPKQLFPDTNN